MPLLLAKNWWSVIVRGLVAILLGVLTLAWPGITVGALVILFGVYAFIDGIVNIAGAWRASKAHERWGVLVIEGLVGIAAGLVTFAWPAITAIVLVYVIATWAIVTGIFEIMAAIRLRKHISGEWLLAIAGAASILFGVLLIAAPLAGALVIAIWIGVYELIFGGMLVGLGLRLRSWSKERGGAAAAVGAS